MLTHKKSCPSSFEDYLKVMFVFKKKFITKKLVGNSKNTEPEDMIMTLALPWSVFIF